MFDLALEEFDFVGGEVEEAVDAVVQFGFGVGQAAGEGFDLRFVLGQIRFPLVGGARVIEGAGRQLEAGLQSGAKPAERKFPLRLGLLVQLALDRPVRFFSKRRKQTMPDLFPSSVRHDTAARTRAAFCHCKR